MLVRALIRAQVNIHGFARPDLCIVRVSDEMAKLTLAIVFFVTSCAVEIGPIDQDQQSFLDQSEIECSPDNGCTGGGGGGGGSCGTCTNTQECYVLCNLQSTPGAWTCQRTVTWAPGYCLWQ